LVDYSLFALFYTRIRLDYLAGNHLVKSRQLRKLNKPISITPRVQLHGMNMLTEPRRSSARGMESARAIASVILTMM